MQLNDIAKGVADKDLIGTLSYQPLNLPVPDPALIEFALGLLDVLHRQGHMWYGRIFDVTARHRRPAFGAHQVDLRGVLVIPDIEPEARNARDVGPAHVSLESQQVRVKLLGLGHVFSTFANANAMVMQFEYFDGHCRFSFTDKPGRGVAYGTPDVICLFCLQTGRDSRSFSSRPFCNNSLDRGHTAVRLAMTRLPLLLGLAWLYEQSNAIENFTHTPGRKRTNLFAQLRF